MKNDTHAIGTALKSRFDMPIDFRSAILNKNEAIYRSANGVLAVMWKDKKDVVVLSTLHSDLKFDETQNRKRKRGVQEEIKKPEVITEYNNGMFGVDQMDQRLSSFPIMRRSIKAYKKYFSICLI